MQVYANMIRAHAAAYRTIHQVQPEARVGIALQYRAVVPHVSWSPLDKLLARIANYLVNNVFPMVFSSGRARTLLGTINVPEAKARRITLALITIREAA